MVSNYGGGDSNRDSYDSGNGVRQLFRIFDSSRQGVSLNQYGSTDQYDLNRKKLEINHVKPKGRNEDGKQ